MNRRRVVAALAGTTLGADFLLSACSSKQMVDEIRYKLTLNVSYGGVTRSGSSVRRLTVYQNSDPFSENTSSVQTVGQAAVVELGERRILLGLLTGTEQGRPRSLSSATREWNDSPITVLIESLGLQQYSLDGGDKLHNLRDRRPHSLSNSQLPDLVTFRDPDDPRSLDIVDPANLGAEFGSSVTFAGATIELTDEPVTTGLSDRLTWLQPDRIYIDGEFRPAPSLAFLKAAFINGVR